MKKDQGTPVTKQSPWLRRGVIGTAIVGALYVGASIKPFLSSLDNNKSPTPDAQPEVTPEMQSSPVVAGEISGARYQPEAVEEKTEKKPVVKEVKKKKEQSKKRRTRAKPKKSVPEIRYIAVPVINGTPAEIAAQNEPPPKRWTAEEMQHSGTSSIREAAKQGSNPPGQVPQGTATATATATNNTTVIINGQQQPAVTYDPGIYGPTVPTLVDQRRFDPSCGVFYRCDAWGRGYGPPLLPPPPLYARFTIGAGLYYYGPVRGFFMAPRIVNVYRGGYYRGGHWYHRGGRVIRPPARPPVRFVPRRPIQHRQPSRGVPVRPTQTRPMQPSRPPPRVQPPSRHNPRIQPGSRAPFNNNSGIRPNHGRGINPGRGVVPSRNRSIVRPGGVGRPGGSRSMPIRSPSVGGRGR